MNDISNLSIALLVLGVFIYLAFLFATLMIVKLSRDTIEESSN